MSVRAVPVRNSKSAVLTNRTVHFIFLLDFRVIEYFLLFYIVFVFSYVTYLFFDD